MTLTEKMYVEGVIKQLTTALEVLHEAEPGRTDDKSYPHAVGWARSAITYALIDLEKVNV